MTAAEELCRRFARTHLPTLLARVDALGGRIRGVSRALDHTAPSLQTPDLEALLEALPDNPAPGESSAGARPDDPALDPGGNLLQRTGWCLAALSNLSGVDLLRARREPWGPLALAELVVESRSGRWGPPPGPSGSPRPVGESSGAKVGEPSDGGTVPFLVPLPSALGGPLFGLYAERLRARPKGAGYELAVILAELLDHALRLAPAGAALPLPEVGTDGTAQGVLVRFQHLRLEPQTETELRWAFDALLPGVEFLSGLGGSGVRVPSGWIQAPGSSA